VEVFIEEETDAVKISIVDSGIGIEAHELDQVFNRFYQADSAGMKAIPGSGIGLALVKELVELHQGKITVESKVNEGTTFVLWLKKGKAHFGDIVESQVKFPDQYNDGEVMSDTFPKKTVLPNSQNEETPIVLIIEDHPELHHYLKSLLSAEYNVLSAYNGAAGIDKAIKVIPDIIISDLMMPEKDGLEVCETLKTDERTSHVPIILLTAKADIETKIKGLETGADDYIAKPFDHQELVARIKNLLNQRSVWRQKFKDEVHFVPSEISSNHADRQFIQRVLEVVNSEMSNETFGVEELAKEMAMSRTQLNRKLRDLLDQSTNKFIQSCRLNKALELLKKPGHNVSDIAHSTGFSSDAYFVKCFKEQFGVTPGKYFEKT
jgi:DNA-binding response OmpR family regulator